MTTTATILATKDAAKVALSLVVDGLPLAFTTHDVAADMSTAWAGTDWATAGFWKTGLRIAGSSEQSIIPFNPEIAPDSLDLYILDTDDSIAASLLRESYSSGVYTNLTADIDCDDTTLNVTATADFAASGTLYLGSQETVTYSGKTGTTFTGVTRGKYSLFTTFSGAPFAHPFRLNTTNSTIDGTAYRTAVSNYPRAHFNRSVALYLHHYEDGAWSTKANSKLLWAGRIKSIGEDGQGNIKLSCTSVMESLLTNLWERPYTAKVQEGFFFPRASLWMHIKSWQQDATGTVTIGHRAPAAMANPTLLTGVRYTHRQLAAEINNQLDTWFVTSSNAYGNGCALSARQDDEGKTRYHFTWHFASGISSLLLYSLDIGLSEDAWSLLGWARLPSDRVVTVDGVTIIYKRLQRSSNASLYRIEAPVAPLRWKPMAGRTFGGVYQLNVDQSTIQGTWQSQASLPVGFERIYDGTDVNGFLLVGTSHLLAVRSIGSGGFRVLKDLSEQFFAGKSGLGFGLNTDADDLNSRDDGTGTQVEVKQVWIETGRTYEIFRKLLLSTGTSAFNHTAEVDAYNANLAVGIPYSLIDYDSLRALGSNTYALVITKPIEFRALLESILAVSGAYVVWKNGKISFQRPMSSFVAEYALTESNKALTDAGDAGRSIVERSPDGIINTVTLNFHHQVTGDFLHTHVVSDDSSISDFGQRKAATIDGYGIYNYFLNEAYPNTADSWASKTAASALAHFSRPPCYVSRTYDFSLVGMAPGDTVSITDQSVVNPATGTRGISAMAAWVLSTSFDWNTGVGTCRVVLMPHVDNTRRAPWAPSARVASYVAATKVLTMEAHIYSLTTEVVDAGRFVAGDKVQLSEQGPVVAVHYTGLEVASVSTSGNGSVTLTTDPTAGAGLGAGKTYVLEYDQISAVTATQREKAFIADDANNSTGYVGNDAYLWGPIPRDVEPGPFSTQYVYKKIDTNQYAIGQPMSVHKMVHAVDAMNSLNAWRTTQSYVNEVLTTAHTQLGTTPKIVYGSVWVPLYRGNSGLSLRLYVKTSAGTSTFTAYWTRNRFSGTSSTAFLHSDGKYTVDTTTTSTTYEWSNTVIMTYPYRSSGPEAPGGMWLTIVASGSTGAVTASLKGVNVVG